MQTFRKPFLALAAAALLCSAQQPPPVPQPPAGGDAKVTWKVNKGDLFYATWKFSHVRQSTQSKNLRAAFSDKREAEMEWTAETGIQGYGRLSVRLLSAKWIWANALYEVSVEYEEGSEPKENVKQKAKDDPSKPIPIKQEAQQRLEDMKRSITSKYTVWVAADGTAMIATAPGQMNDGLFRTSFRRLNPVVPREGFDPAAGWPVPLTDMPFELAQMEKPGQPHTYKIDYDPQEETKIDLEMAGNFPTLSSFSSTVSGSGTFTSKTIFVTSGYLVENTRTFSRVMNEKSESRAGKVDNKTEDKGSEQLKIDPGPAPAKGKKGTSRREAAKQAKKAMDVAEARQTVLQYIIEKKDQLTERPLKFPMGTLVGDKTVVQDISEKEITLGITIAGGTASTPLPISSVTDENLLNLLRMIIRKPDGKLGEAVEVVKAALE